MENFQYDEENYTLLATLESLEEFIEPKIYELLKYDKVVLEVLTFLSKNPNENDISKEIQFLNKKFSSLKDKIKAKKDYISSNLSNVNLLQVKITDIEKENENLNDQFNKSLKGIDQIEDLVKEIKSSNEYKNLIKIITALESNINSKNILPQSFTTPGEKPIGGIGSGNQNNFNNLISLRNFASLNNSAYNNINNNNNNYSPENNFVNSMPSNNVIPASKTESRESEDYSSDSESESEGKKQILGPEKKNIRVEDRILEEMKKIFNKNLNLLSKSYIKKFNKAITFESVIEPESEKIILTSKCKSKNIKLIMKIDSIIEFGAESSLIRFLNPFFQNYYFQIDDVSKKVYYAGKLRYNKDPVSFAYNQLNEEKLKTKHGVTMLTFQTYNFFYEMIMSLKKNDLTHFTNMNESFLNNIEAEYKLLTEMRNEYLIIKDEIKKNVGKNLKSI